MIRIPYSEAQDFRFQIQRVQIVQTKLFRIPELGFPYMGCHNVEFSQGDVTRDDSQRRFLAQHSVATLLRHCFEWLQHCSSIATLCCSKNRRCESSRVTSPLNKREQLCAQDGVDSTVKYDPIRCRFKNKLLTISDFILALYVGPK